MIECAHMPDIAAQGALAIGSDLELVVKQTCWLLLRDKVLGVEFG
jgi:hypothetical protein